MSTKVVYKHYIHFMDGQEEGVQYFKSVSKAMDFLNAHRAKMLPCTLWEETITTVVHKVDV